MTETGNEQVELTEKQLNKVAELMEQRSVAEKQPAYAELLKPDQVEGMLKAGIESMEDVRAASDEALIKIKGIGSSALQALREWSSKDIGKGNAIARRYLALNNGKETLDVKPGDIIPEKFGAAEMVEKGKASWE